MPCVLRGSHGVQPGHLLPLTYPCSPSGLELHIKLQSSEAEVKSKCEELSSLHGQLKDSRAENSQLTERIRSIEALLEAGQARDAQVSWHFLPGADRREGRMPLSSELDLDTITTLESDESKSPPSHQLPSEMRLTVTKELSVSIPGQPSGGRPAAGSVSGG